MRRRYQETTSRTEIKTSLSTTSHIKRIKKGSKHMTLMTMSTFSSTSKISSSKEHIGEADTEDYKRRKFQNHRALFYLFRLCALVPLAFLLVNLTTILGPSNSGLRSSRNLTEEEALHMEKVSVIMMNYARPQNVQKSKLMPTLLESDLIGEVLLTHHNPDTFFEYHHPKVRNIRAFDEEAKYGLSCRFWFCAHDAKYPWVIHVDDDMEFPVSTLEAMVHEFARDPDRIVGVYGRLLNYFLMSGPIASGYNTFDFRGDVDVVITKLMIMPQKVCRYFHEFEYLVKEFVAAESQPHWNGEDLFMSLVTNHVYKHGIVNATTVTPGFNKYNRTHQNYAMAWLEVDDVGDKYGSGAHLSISGNVNDVRPWSGDWWKSVFKSLHHAQYRGKFWRMAAQLLEESVTDSAY